ncbi:MAG: DUF1640 domain-containing protein [Pseudomonadota bacterium]|nr:DUF1640 domain-containing protein [Pseudomonadota bacterium]
MSTITFDTYRFVKRLKEAGIPEAHAEAEAEALSNAIKEALESQLASKNDVQKIEKELLVVKWMTGLVLSGVAALVLKTFF